MMVHLFRNVLSGQTSRQIYLLVIALVSFAYLVLFHSQHSLSRAVMAGAAFFLLIVVALLTMSRLHNASISRLWALLFFFPGTMFWNIGSIRLGGAVFQLIDLSFVIRLAPIAAGLIVRSSGHRTKDPVPSAEAAFGK
jgi:uncharacterized membrane protein YhaH (DUF805 family)